jgi:hypothetical protein
MAGSAFCYFHNPDVAQARRAARQRGGVTRGRRSVVLPADEPDAPLATVADVTAYLGRVANATAKGLLEPKVSNATVYALSTLVNAILKGDHEERLRRVEQALAAVEAVKKGKR